MWKTLIPVDESSNALRAVQYAADSLQRDPQQEFVLINVQPPFPLRTHAVLSHDEMQRIVNEEGAKVIAPARAILDKAGAKYSVVSACGVVDDVIARQIEESRCNAVIMGTRGAGAVGNLVLGSVATKVIHAVKVPVTLIK